MKIRCANGRGKIMIDKTLLKNDFEDILRDSAANGKRRSPAQLHDALSKAIMRQAVPMMNCSAPDGRRAGYLSMEFLVGREIGRASCRERV